GKKDDLAIRLYLEELNIQLLFTKRYGDFKELYKMSHIEFEIGSRGLFVSDFYYLLGSLTQAVYKVRNCNSIEQFNRSYKQLFALRQFDKISFLNFQNKDVLV